MKRIVCLTLIGLTVVYFGSYVQAAETQDHEVLVEDAVTLTKEQQEELDVLYKDILESMKTLAQKYEEYGVISGEKKDKLISKMEKRYTKIKEEGYVFKWHKHKCKERDHRED